MNEATRCPACQIPVSDQETVCPSCKTLLGHQAVALPAAASLPDVPGYEVMEEIGRGGMGVIYKARHRALDRVVALKMLPFPALVLPELHERFQTEARAVARLRHANIVQVYEVGTSPTPFFALEYIEGGNLEARLNRGPLGAQEAASLVEQLARAVQVAHEAGVVHRDLKPANVLLSAKPQAAMPKITDFGLARLLDDGQRKTQEGALLGTPCYMAPEQARGNSSEVGPGADVYALGTILYECLTGRPPFLGATTTETLLQVIQNEPLPPSRLTPGCPRDLETICLKCLQKEPGRRYASAMALAEDLRRFQDREPILARPAGWLERTIKWARRRPAVAALAAVLLLSLTSLVAGGAVYAIHLDEARREADRERVRAKEGESTARRETERAEEKEKEARAQGERAKRGEDAAVLEKEKADRERTRAELGEAAAQKQLALTKEHLLTSQLQRVAAVFERYPTRAWTLLQDDKACPAELQDAAWRLYANRCRVLHQTLEGPEEDVNVLAFSPDGKYVAAGTGEHFSSSSDVERKQAGDIWLYEVATGKRLARLMGHKDQIHAMAFRRDGKQLASVSRDGTTRLWDVEGKKLLKTFKVAGTSVAFYSADEKELIVAGSKVHRIDTISGFEVYVRDTTFATVALRPDGKMAACQQSGFERLHEVKLLPLYGADSHVLTHSGPAYVLAFSADGKRIAVGGAKYNSDKNRYENNEVRIWDVETGKFLQAIKNHPDGVQSLAFSPDGTSLAIGYGSQYTRPVDVWLWDLETGQPRQSFEGSYFRCWAVAFSADGRWLASGGRDRVTRLWDLRAGAVRKFEIPEATSYLAVMPDRTSLVTADWKGNVTTSDLATGKRLDHFEDKDLSVRTVWSSADGKELRFVGSDRAIHVWDRVGKKRLRKTPLIEHGDSFDILPRFNPDGQLLATTSSDVFVRFWDVESGRELHKIQARNNVVGLAWSPDGKRLAVGCEKWEGASVEVWIDGQETPLYRLAVPGKKDSMQSLRALAFSPDGNILAGGGSNGVIMLWDLQTGKTLHTLKGHVEAIWDLAFTKDSKTLASGMSNSVGYAGEIRLWDVQTGQERAAIGGHSDSVFRVLFGPDDQSLIASSADKKIWIWDLKR